MLPADHPEAVEQIRRTQSEESAVNSPATSSTAFESKSQTTVKKPVRRKPRQSLEAMSAALDKGKKMTTLEKVSQWPRMVLTGCSLRWTGRAIQVGTGRSMTSSRRIGEPGGFCKRKTFWTASGSGDQTLLRSGARLSDDQSPTLEWHMHHVVQVTTGIRVWYLAIYR